MGRKNYIDYAKALCIIAIVFVHIGFSALNNVLLFLMPLFFAATGYTFSYGKRTAAQNIIIRFKTIMIPFFLIMLVYTLIEIPRAILFGYGDATIAYPSLVNTVYGSGILPWEGGFFDTLKDIMSYKTQPQTGVDLILPSNCHLWFLPAMFTAYTLFVLIVKVVKRNHPAKAAAICTLLLLASLELIFPQLLQLPFALGRGAFGATFMLFGFWLKDYKLLENKSKKYFALTNILALALFIGALLLGSNGSAFIRSVYGPYNALSVFISFIGGAAGVWLIISLSKAIEKLRFEAPKKLLSYIGKNVMTVYAWHMAVKFLFDAIYICLIKKSDFSLLDEYKMGLIPQESALFMVFEAFAVIAICLLFCLIKNKIKSADHQGGTCEENRVYEKGF